jgi:hypothetical protein
MKDWGFWEWLGFLWVTVTIGAWIIFHIKVFIGLFG